MALTVPRPNPPELDRGQPHPVPLPPPNRSSVSLSAVSPLAELGTPTKHYAEFRSNFTGSANLRLRPYKDSLAHLRITEGELFFVAKIIDGGMATGEASGMTLSQMNNMLGDIWRLQNQAFGDLKTKLLYSMPMPREMQGQQQLGRGVTTYTPAEIQTLAHYLTLPEPCWSVLFRGDNALLNRNPKGKLLQMVVSEGMFHRWNYAGGVLVPPKNFYPQYKAPSKEKDSSMTLCSEGSIELLNVWGAEATANASLFLVYKRLVVNDATGEHGRFAWIPEASHHGPPSLSQRFYKDHTGAATWGKYLYI